MAVGYEITFLPERRTISFSGSYGDYYRFTDGHEISLRSWPSWCNRCAKVCHGESIPSLPEIDQQIASLERLAGEIRAEIDPDGDGYQQEQIAELKLRRRWRGLRKSPPRCLACGSTNIVRLEQGKAVLAGTGTIVLNARSLIDSFRGRSYYTPEGERILAPPNRPAL